MFGNVKLSEKEEIEMLLKSKARIEKKINWHEKELEQLHIILSVLDRRISDKSFKGAETLQVKAKPATSKKAPTPPIQAPPADAAQTAMQTVPLKMADGTLLGTIYFNDKEIKAIPPPNIAFNANTPPFNQFLITKIINGMISKDRSDAMDGKTSPDEILTYRVIQEGDIIKEISIRNYGDERRAMTLKNSIRWTLEKMYEKMKLKI